MFWHGGSGATRQGGRASRSLHSTEAVAAPPPPCITTPHTAPLRTPTRLYLYLILLHACNANDFLNVMEVDYKPSILFSSRGALLHYYDEKYFPLQNKIR